MYGVLEALETILPSKDLSLSVSRHQFFTENLVYKKRPIQLTDSCNAIYRQQIAPTEAVLMKR